MAELDNCCSTQLIDGDGDFNAVGLENFMRTTNFSNRGLSYAVVAIKGPQSSGKSTLLNHLFHTNFREMDAYRGRSQTTKGIWIAHCVGIEPFTIAMDLEGTDGRERGEDDTTFEKQSALFALAIADIVLINMWCHDIGREQAANKPLLKTVFQVMMRLFSPRRTTLLFVIRDKTKTPLEYLEPILREDIQKIWDVVSKPEAHKDTPLSEFFNVEITALSSYEEKEELFKEQVAELRQRFFNSISPGGLAGDRRGVVPASGFSFSAQQIWKVIKENKDLDLPAHKVMVATVRCEEIANEKFCRLSSDADWLALEESVQSGSISGFGRKLSSILETYFSEYDLEAIYFDEAVRSAKRKQLESKALELVHPAYLNLLGHLRFKALEDFKSRLEQMLKEGEGFAASAHACTKSCMLEFDKGCADAAIRQANWDASKVREKLRRDIDAHISSVRNVKLSELVGRYEEKLRQSLSEPVESLFDAAGRDTWASIRKLLTRETENAVSEFSTAISSFELDQPTTDSMLQGLRDYVRNLVLKKAKEQAGKVLILMKDRFSTVFSHDNHSMPRVWTGKEDIKTITKDARTVSLRLLAVMAAIRLDEKSDKIENILFSSLMEGTVTSPDPLASSTWEEVPPENTLITPVQCKALWRQFKAETEFTVTQAISAQEAYKRSNNWLPPPWAIVAMVILGFNEFMLLLRNPLYLMFLFVAFLISKAMWVHMDVPGQFQHGTVSQQFAECISLPNRTTVQVRVASNLTKATLVTIEPYTEDDWEILELNSEHAEDAILKQVRIVYEGMRFPLWLHGRTIINFHVMSTFPNKAVVQLVHGTEVAVAPKRRKKILNNMESSNGESHGAKAQLRLQDSDRRLFHRSTVKGVELGVALTSVAFIHQETAERFSLKSLQLVLVVPRFSSKENLESDASRMKGSLTSKEINSGLSTDNKEFRDFRQVIVRLLISDSVAKGHIMVTRSLRLYLGAGQHSWVYLKGYNGALKKEIPVLSLSPCHFKMVANDKALGNGLEMLDGNKTHRKQSSLPISGSGTSLEVVNWSNHENVVTALSCGSPCQEAENCNHQDNNKKGLECLLQAWFLAQLDALASNAGMEVNTLVLGNKNLLHFEVTINDSGTYGYVSSNGFSEKRNKTKDLPMEISYILTISEETPHNGQVNAYELELDDRNKRVDVQGGVELFGKLNLGNPVSLSSVKDRASVKGFSTNASSLSWMGAAASDVINRLMVLQTPASGIWFSTHSLPLPGHVLIYGPAGSGKTLLARAVAKSLEEHEDLLAHVIFISCSGLSLEKAPTIRQALSSSISEALDHAPSVVVFDDLDSVIQSSSDSEGSQPSTSVVALTKFLTEIIDEYGKKRKSSCGIGPVAFIASVQSLESIPQSLSSSGRFDFHVQLPAPAASERRAILKHEIQRRSLQCHDDIVMDVASKCDGYDAYDLEILVDRAVHAAVGRFLPSDSDSEERMPLLVRDDFSHAMHEFLPVAMRDISKSAPDVGRTGWDEVGGLNDIRDAIKEMIELPSKFPNIFAKAPLRLRSNVLLYGPPGCGKTHIVGAAAAACSLRFISVKGPELLNKYIGASEQAVRDIFSKAAAAAPCLLFFDEFDSIAPKRGHDNTGVTDRVVNQFLTELDGVEVLTGVFVFAATSRPDLLDAALLRPGRLDRLLFCDFPSPRERLDILTVLSRKLPLASDVDLDTIAHVTEGFSGADLQALLSDAQLAAVHEHLSSANSNEPGKMPVITDAVLKSIASKARPSVSEAEKKRLYGIYSQFLDSKRSAATQSRDAKGKRATLA